MIAATEDSWEHTIVPRLLAAGADLELVYRVDVTEGGLDGYLTLPSDIFALQEAVNRVGAVLVALDPLMSRLSTKLDSHKDHEVRVALEPLTSFAKASSAAVVGIIHVNKSVNADPLSVIMGSRAFTAVARSVLFAIKHPETDDETCLFGQIKNNLGPKDPRTYRYRIVGEKVAETLEGEIWTGKVDWLGKSDRSIEDIQSAVSEGGMEVLSSVDEALAWLEDYLNANGGTKESTIVKDAGAKAGHNARNLQRAASKRKVRVESAGFPRRTIWSLTASNQVMPNGDKSLESRTTVTTVTTGGHTLGKEHASPVASGDSGDSYLTLQGNGTTGGRD